MSVISIISTSAQQATTNPCSQMRMALTFTFDTNQAPQQTIIPIRYDYNQPNEVLVYASVLDIVSTVGGVITYEVARNIPRRTSPLTSVKVESQTGLYTQIIQTPTGISQWSIENATSITGVDNLGTVTVDTNVSTTGTPLNLEYSLDDVTYVNNNVITGVAPGDYTLYVKDDFGCTKTQFVTVLSEPTFGVLNNFSHVSLLNSIPFTKINNDPANFDNTPSYKVDAETLYSDLIYQYKANDVINFQFRSNYDVNKAYLLDCGVIQQELAVNQITDNLNQRDIRQMRPYFQQGILYLYNDGTGNVYENDGTTVIGQNEFDGGLLNTQQIGDVIELENIGLVQIIAITEISAGIFALKTSYNQSISDPYVKVTTFLDSLTNFNVFEFSYTISALDTTDKRYQIVLVLNSDEDFDPANPLVNATHVSEVFTPFQNKKLHKFVWKNSENNQFNWDTGIECLSYLPKLFEPTFQPEDENEIYTTDTSQFMLESDIKETYTFNFDVLSLIQFRHLNFITSNDYLQIDGLFYVKEETPEGEALIGSNGYDVKAKLSVSSNYNSNERYL